MCSNWFCSLFHSILESLKMSSTDTQDLWIQKLKSSFYKVFLRITQMDLRESFPKSRLNLIKIIAPMSGEKKEWLILLFLEFVIIFFIEFSNMYKYEWFIANAIVVCLFGYLMWISQSLKFSKKGVRCKELLSSVL